MVKLFERNQPVVLITSREYVAEHSRCHSGTACIILRSRNCFDSNFSHLEAFPLSWIVKKIIFYSNDSRSNVKDLWNRWLFIVKVATQINEHKNSKSYCELEVSNITSCGEKITGKNFSIHILSQFFDQKILSIFMGVKAHWLSVDCEK